MKLYVRLTFSPDGADPLSIVGSMKEIGFSAVLGDYDFAFEFSKPEDYRAAISRMHTLLKGTGVRYSIASKR